MLMIIAQMFLIIDKIKLTWSCFHAESIKVFSKLNILHPVTLNVCALIFFDAPHLK
jgi:hypothetical protein